MAAYPSDVLVGASIALAVVAAVKLKRVPPGYRVLTVVGVMWWGATVWLNNRKQDELGELSPPVTQLAAQAPSELVPAEPMSPDLSTPAPAYVPPVEESDRDPFESARAALRSAPPTYTAPSTNRSLPIPSGSSMSSLGGITGVGPSSGSDSNSASGSLASELDEAMKAIKGARRQVQVVKDNYKQMGGEIYGTDYLSALSNAMGKIDIAVAILMQLVEGSRSDDEREDYKDQGRALLDEQQEYSKTMWRIRYRTEPP